MSTSSSGCGWHWAHTGLDSELGNSTKEPCMEQVLHEPQTSLQDTTPAAGAGILVHHQAGPGKQQHMQDFSSVWHFACKSPPSFPKSWGV